MSQGDVCKMYSRSILSLTLSFSGWNLAPNVPAVVQKNSRMHLSYAVKADNVIIAASDEKENAEIVSKVM